MPVKKEMQVIKKKKRKKVVLKIYACVIKNLCCSGFFCLWDPKIDDFPSWADRAGGWRRESVHTLTFTIDHVWNLRKKKSMFQKEWSSRAIHVVVLTVNLMLLALCQYGNFGIFYKKKKAIDQTSNSDQACSFGLGAEL